MRKLVVKHFALNFTVKLFGANLTGLRCTRIMAPYFILMALIIALDPLYPVLQWWDLALLIGFAVMVWLSFPMLGLGYFELWPVKRDELDEEQKKQFDTAPF